MKLSELTHRELKTREAFRCPHGHNGITHQKCFNEFHGIEEIVGHLDIESTGLNANFDFVISYAIKSRKGITGRVLTQQEVLDWRVLDRNLCREFCKEVRKFERIIVYWGKDRRHDIPFLRTRCLKWNCNFPAHKELSVTDAYDIAKNKLRLHRNRLETVADFLKVPAKQHRLDAREWQKAKLGWKPSLRYVWLHNREDVITLERVYNKLIKYSAQRKTSI